MNLHYFQINLNKYDERTHELEKKRRAFISKVIFFFFIFTAFCSFLIYQTMELDQKIEDRHKKLIQVEKEIAALEQKEDFISRKDVFALQEIEEKRLLWAKKFARLAVLIPNNMAITNTDFRQDRLRIQGLSKIIDEEREFDRVVEFMNRIKSDPEFTRDIEDVRFEESNRVTINKENLLNYIIACHFRNR